MKAARVLPLAPLIFLTACLPYLQVVDARCNATVRVSPGGLPTVSTSGEGSAPQPRSPLNMRVDPHFSVAGLGARDPEAARWYRELISASNYADDSAPYSLMVRSGSCDVKDLARSVNQQVYSVLAVFRVTGSAELLGKVYEVMQRARATLKDTDGDGYLNWVYLAENTDQPRLLGTDYYVMEELMAHAMVAQAAWAFEVNRDLAPEYAEAADFWLDYLLNHFEAKWRAREGVLKGHPFLDKDLMHPYANWTRYFVYMAKLTGDEGYLREAQRRIGVIRRAFQVSEDGAFVWTHPVNEIRDEEDRRFRYQPAGYAGETMGALVDLALEGFLDDAFMRRVAKTLTQKLLDERGYPDILAEDVGQGTPETFYLEWLGRSVTYEASTYDGEWGGRGYVGTYVARPYALLAPWDGTGEVLSDSADYFKENDHWLHVPAGSVLARLYEPGATN